MKTVFQSQLEDRAAFEGLMQSEAAHGMAESAGEDMALETAARRILDGDADLYAPNATEAIVMRTGYPSLLVREGDYEEPANLEWRRRLSPHRKLIKNVIANTGRVDLVGFTSDWLGTAWRVNEDTFVTNRHVAAIFAGAKGSGFAVNRGIKAYVDLSEEHLNDEELENFVQSVVHIEPASAGAIDAAILRIDRSAAKGLKGEPIRINDSGAMPEFIGVVGYPARAVRDNPVDAMNDYFRDIYDVKRFAPGRIMEWSHEPTILTHNCTTLGGNSGSVVFDLKTGCAVGLHFAGHALKQNYAVKADALAKLLKKTSVSFTQCAVAGGGAGSGGAGSAGGGEGRDTDFSDRDGYDPHFLGGNLVVPLPQLNAVQRRKVAKTSEGAEILDYRHYSVVMNKARRMAYFSAVNIDGRSLRRPARSPGFSIDPRLDEKLQTGEELYQGNDFDRGHLVRRLDPVWGDETDANQANIDSMYFPNIAPQHKNLNQKIWLALEDHILETTDAENLRVSAIVGCVFTDDDPVHRSTGLKVPLAYWKIVASPSVKSGRDGSRRLQAQAFVMSQEQMIRKSDLEFAGELEYVFGDGFEVYQLSVEDLEKMTGLDFDVLRAADTFGAAMEAGAATEAAAKNESPSRPIGERLKGISSLDDIVM